MTGYFAGFLTVYFAGGLASILQASCFFLEGHDHRCLQYRLQLSIVRGGGGGEGISTHRHPGRIKPRSIQHCQTGRGVSEKRRAKALKRHGLTVAGSLKLMVHLQHRIAEAPQEPAGGIQLDAPRSEAEAHPQVLIDLVANGRLGSNSSATFRAKDFMVSLLCFPPPQGPG